MCRVASSSCGSIEPGGSSAPLITSFVTFRSEANERNTNGSRLQRIFLFFHSRPVQFCSRGSLDSSGFNGDVVVTESLLETVLYAIDRPDTRQRLLERGKDRTNASEWGKIRKTGCSAFRGQHVHLCTFVKRYGRQIIHRVFLPTYFNKM